MEEICKKAIKEKVKMFRYLCELCGAKYLEKEKDHAYFCWRDGSLLTYIGPEEDEEDEKLD